MTDPIDKSAGDLQVASGRHLTAVQFQILAEVPVAVG